MPTSTPELVIPEGSPRRIGVVESDKRNKTRKVVIAYSGKHAKYGKYLRKRTVLQVHDEKNESRLGDRVEVAECRPISKTKSWVLVRVVEREVGDDQSPQRDEQPAARYMKPGSQVASHGNATTIAAYSSPTTRKPGTARNARLGGSPITAAAV